MISTSCPKFVSAGGGVYYSLHQSHGSLLSDLAASPHLLMHCMTMYGSKVKVFGLNFFQCVQERLSQEWKVRAFLIARRQHTGLT